VGRIHGRHRFEDADLDMAMTFANHAALALELADARDDQQRVVLLEDRDRIARDLHDHVIQRLFAAGLTVQSVASGLGASELAGRLSRVVSDLDETIRQIRTSIFQLRGPLGPQTGTLRTSLLAVVAEATPLLGFEPRVRFTGPIDAVVPDAVVDDIVAVLREALSNVARHANASRADVEVTASATDVAIEVTDDGVGIGDASRRSGLANLRLRAERHGGTLELTHATPRDGHPIAKGTRLRWTIPLT
jgi:signal transduction histidine kinase